jgi:miniconductance mechanosensitive channel
MSQLQQWLLPWLTQVPNPELVARILSVIAGYLTLFLVYQFSRRLFLPSLEKITVRLAPNRVGSLRQHFTKLNRRLAGLICSVVFLSSFDWFFLPTELNHVILVKLGQIALIIYAGFIVSSIATIAGAAYNQLAFSKDVPILGLIQVIKLATFIVSAILIISLLLDKSPTYILSGFGALAAVLMLVFKDTILGFVASIQIAANRLVANGDWIQFDSYGADGEVEEIGLNTVKVRNWDKTITTIPTYALIASSFKNWRGMQESGGRRIKRAINIDLYSFKPCDDNLLARLQANELIAKVLDDKLNSTLLGKANVSIFRLFAEEYLKQHTQLNHGLTLMVRELAPTEFGLPIEIYCFSEDKRWIPYEHLQADLIDMLFSQLSNFELKPYQALSSLNH